MKTKNNKNKVPFNQGKYAVMNTTRKKKDYFKLTNNRTLKRSAQSTNFGNGGKVL